MTRLVFSVVCKCNNQQRRLTLTSAQSYISLAARRNCIDTYTNLHKYIHHIHTQIKPAEHPNWNTHCAERNENENERNECPGASFVKEVINK
jgi:hypothetical protein